MTRKHIYKYILPILAIVAIVVIVPHGEAHAQSFFGIPSISDLIEQGMAWFMNQLLALMSLFLTITGYLLNFSINLTLQIKSFVDSTPAIYTTWRTIRDIAGLAMIFFLLYAAFQLITGIERPKFGDLIKNIVIAGILVNFSFFFAGLGIDASNIVSVQIYNAIAPANSLNPGAANTNLANSSWSSTYDGGLSDIFMQSLQIQKVYKQKFAELGSSAGYNGGSDGVATSINNAAAKTIASAPVKIFLMGAVAVLIEFCAAMSFGAAALAFIFRFVILLLLLAFSPIWMLGFLPEVGEYTKKWSNTYKAMLIFMPVYLLLMYVALSVLTTSPMFGGGLANTVAATPGNAPGQVGRTFIENAFAANTGAQDGSWYNGFLILGVNSAIVIVLLNMPLAAAASIAGGTIGLLKKAEGKFGYGHIFGKTAGMASGYLGAGWKYSPGQQFAQFDKNLGKTKLGNTLLARDIRGATTGAVAKAKFGGDRTAEDYRKEGKEVTKTGAEILRSKQLRAAVAGAPMVDPITKKSLSAKDVMKKMTEKERIGMPASELVKPELLRNLSKDDFKAILKADATEISDTDKARILAARGEQFANAVTNKDVAEVKSLMKGLETDEWVGMVKDAGAPWDAVVANINPSHLKDIMEKSLLSEPERKTLGSMIDTWETNPKNPTPGTRHQAKTYINKPDNKPDWL